MSKTLLFIEKATATHGDLYDYAGVDYIRSRDKITITCRKHGDFEQTPSAHLKGHGCVKCATSFKIKQQSQASKDTFIDRSKAIHGNIYDYSKTNYATVRKKVTITCKRHGDFEQHPGNHLKGAGCSKCATEVRAGSKINAAGLRFASKSVLIHGNRYDYSKIDYRGNSTKVLIVCKEHGGFYQEPSNHLKGNWCPSCPKRCNQPTNLYLIHNGLGKVKVGYAIDINRRMREINLRSPFTTEILEFWTLQDTPTVVRVERCVHHKLRKYHAGLSGFDGATEWFNTTHARARDVILETLKSQSVIDHVVYDNAQPALFSKVRC